jgi:hypothetical protein
MAPYKIKTNGFLIKIVGSAESWVKYLTEYYNNYDEEGRLTSKHGQVEYLTTMKYINKF